MIEKKNILIGQNIRPASHLIWQEIKTRHEIKKSAKALHSFAKCNKYNIRILLGITQSHQDSHTEIWILMSPPDLQISKEKWDIIAPEEYLPPSSSKFLWKHFLPETRNLDWCSFRINLQEPKLPCTWVFKGCFVGKTGIGRFFIKIEGGCKCKST